MKATVSKTGHHDRDTAVLEADRLRFDRNVGPFERVASALVGGTLVGLAMTRRTMPSRLVAALVGLPLVARGLTGHCPANRALGINTADSMPMPRTRPRVLRGINVVKSIVIDRPVGECYAFWLNYQKFPHFMDHVESVTLTGEKTSHWIARGPFGRSIEWDAEIVKTNRDRLIEWRSLEGSMIHHAGSVRFEPVDGDRRCKVTVTVRWAPPAGLFGYALGKLTGEEPGSQIEQDLLRFQQVLEVGEVPSA